MPNPSCRISELIYKLACYQKDYGDIDVVYSEGDYTACKDINHYSIRICGDKNILCLKTYWE